MGQRPSEQPNEPPLPDRTDRCAEHVSPELLVTARILDQIHEAVVTTDLKGRITSWNKGAERMFRFTADEILGQPISLLYPDARREHIARTMSQVFQHISEQGEHEEEVQLQRKSGEEFHALLVLALFRGDRGEVLGIIASVLDITRRKVAELQLHGSETFIQNILETVDEGFIIVDHDYLILAANNAYLHRLGLTADAVLGRHCYAVSHHREQPCFLAGENCPVHTTFETGKPAAAMHTHYSEAGGPVYVEIKAYPQYDESGAIVSVIETVTDVTEKRRLEEQLRHAQKMEAVGTLAGGIAHDFNNILSAIIGYGSVLQMKMPTSDPRRNHVDGILEAANRAAALTQGLLTFSRRQPIAMKQVDLHEIISRVEKLLTRIIGEDIALQVHPHPHPLHIMADAGQIEQVLMNLATNARDAMPTGGTLQIASETTILDDEFERTHGYGKVGRYAMLSVTDTGAGMDPQTQKKIFEPFYTTKDVGKGTGLGLAIVYGIVKQHSGYIEVISKQGEGTSFLVYLPLVREVREEILNAPTINIVGGKETILLAEDDAVLRSVTAAALKDFGYTVLEAADGVEAIELFREKQADIQLALLDIVMPRKNGKEVRDVIHAANPAIPCIFLSGYPEESTQIRSLFTDDFEFLRKPVSPRQLLAKVRSLLDRK